MAIEILTTAEVEMCFDFVDGAATEFQKAVETVCGRDADVVYHDIAKISSRTRGVIFAATSAEEFVSKFETVKTRVKGGAFVFGFIFSRDLNLMYDLMRGGIEKAIERAAKSVGHFEKAADAIGGGVCTVHDFIRPGVWCAPHDGFCAYLMRMR